MGRFKMFWERPEGCFGVFNHYALTKEKSFLVYLVYRVLTVFMLCRKKTLLLLLRSDKGTFRDKIGGIGGLRCKRRVKLITALITFRYFLK